MADLQTLFHNPEVLTDRDLGQIKSHMRLQRIFPYASTAAFGGFMYFMDTAVFRKSVCFKRLGLMSAVGFFWGASYSHLINNKTKTHKFSEIAQENFDKDIIGAFEHKYVERSLNAAGYGNNALNVGSHSKESNAQYKKPY